MIPVAELKKNSIVEFGNIIKPLGFFASREYDKHWKKYSKRSKQDDKLFFEQYTYYELGFFKYFLRSSPVFFEDKKGVFWVFNYLSEKGNSSGCSGIRILDDDYPGGPIYLAENSESLANKPIRLDRRPRSKNLMIENIYPIKAPFPVVYTERTGFPCIEAGYLIGIDFEHGGILKIAERRKPLLKSMKCLHDEAFSVSHEQSSYTNIKTINLERIIMLQTVNIARDDSHRVSFFS